MRFFIEQKFCLCATLRLFPQKNQICIFSLKKTFADYFTSFFAGGSSTSSSSSGKTSSHSSDVTPLNKNSRSAGVRDGQTSVIDFNQCLQRKSNCSSVILTTCVCNLPDKVLLQINSILSVEIAFEDTTLL